MLGTLSALWARIEVYLAAFFAATVTVLILLNIITRNLGIALYWVDELAIYAMIWMTFLGASAGFHYGHGVAVTIVTDHLPQAVQRYTAKLVDLIVVLFAGFMIWFCWLWFDPLMLAQSGFDTKVFQRITFNFIYAEPTTTLGIRKFWVWSVICFFSMGLTVHSLANLFACGAEIKTKATR